MTIYRYIVRVPVRNREPIIANCDRWLNHEYLDRKPEHQISVSYPAYSQDNKECVAILYCKNDDILRHLIRDFKLEVINSNAEADALTVGWKRGSNSKFEDLTSKSTTSRNIDSSSIEEITECCKGCKYNPDGRALPVIVRKAAPAQSETPVIMKDAYIEESKNEVAFTIENSDETKLSYVLENRNKSIFSEKAVIAAKELLKNCGSSKSIIAALYMRENRNVEGFLYEIIALSKFVSELPPISRFLLKRQNPESLLHNRVMAQLLYEYSVSGCNIDLKPDNGMNGKHHDFNACGIRCEVKTLRTQGFYEQHPSRRVRFTSTCQSEFLEAIKSDIEEATAQVGNGMIFLAPLSPSINSLMRAYFLEQLFIVPPLPKPNTTVLVLDSDELFGAHYFEFPTSFVIANMDRILNEINSFGVPLRMHYGKSGLSLRLATAAKEGSSIGWIGKDN